jgi:hypothetical protein
MDCIVKSEPPYLATTFSYFLTTSQKHISLKVVGNVFFLYFFGEVFEKIKTHFGLVVGYFSILQHIKILQKINVDCRKRNTKKPIYITKNL